MAPSISNIRPRSRAIVAASAAALVLILIGLATYGLWPVHKSPFPQSAVPTAKLSSGHHIPLFGLGTFQCTGQESTDAIRAGLAAGYRHIDTAQMYGNEEDIGVALNEALKSGQVKREELFITTKVNTQNHARERVELALRESLKRLQLEFVDLYLVHWPVTDQPGPTLQPSMQETWEGMQDVADKGLSRSIGISNISPEKIKAWFTDARIPPAVLQVEVHPNWRQEKVIDHAKEAGIHVTAYAPMSSPGTTRGRFPNLQKDTTILTIAEANNKTAQQVLLQWGLQHGSTEHISVIPKSCNPEHIKSNFGAVGGSLSQADFDTISNFEYQARYFRGSIAISEEGPWHNYQELWDEEDPEAAP